MIYVMSIQTSCCQMPLLLKQRRVNQALRWRRRRRRITRRQEQVIGHLTQAQNVIPLFNSSMRHSTISKEN